MRKRVFALLSCLALSIGLLTAQTSGVQGIVVSAEDGEPVIGASVLVKGTTVGAVTDIDGKFTIANLPAGAKTLQVSFVGMLTYEAAIRPGTIKIELKSDAGLLDEVVITGYGNVKKSAYAGSASTVKADRIKDIPAVSFTDMLQGNAPGVQFSASSGQPGSAASINIRGMGSMNASTQPLYVIDGVPVRSGNIDQVGSDAGLDVMTTITPSDIENISIIKDAAAASLYGSRAANGVIIITTKKGKPGKPVVSLKADWGSSDFAMQYRPVMGGAERREYIYDALYRGAIRDGETEADAKAYADEEVEKNAPVPWCGYVDWDALTFRKGNHQTYEASIAGGTEKFKYFSSLSYLSQEGVTVNSALERISARLNVDYNATNKLKLGANILLSNVNQDVYGEGTSYTSPFYTTRNCVVPSDPVYNEDGSWNRSFIRNSDRNPILAATYDYDRQYVNRSFNTLYAEYEFIKDLKFKTTLSYDYTIIKGIDWSDPRTSNGDDYNGSMSKTYREYKKTVWANQLSYATTIADHHHLDVLAGFETDDQYTDYLSGNATNFATAAKNAISNGMTTESVSGADSNQRIVSYLSRVNYDYAGKYFLGGSYRVDGSSRLHKDNRWGSFWSFSGAWRIIEEGFMKETKTWLSDLKVRASYGVNGTLPSDYYGYMGLSSLTSGYMDQPGIIPSQIANKDLKWETNYNLNLGVDFGLWNRINVSLEYYTRTTKNLLMDRPISMTTGFGSYLMNIGEMQNRGVELEINSDNVKTKDFSWRTGLNISHNRNEVVKLDGAQTEIISGNQIRKIGKPYRTFYMIEFAGINPETGAPQFYKNDVDENGNYNKEITEKNSEAKAIVLDKHAEPTFIGGLSNSLTYKWFDLSFLFSYQFGGYSYDNWAQKTEHGGYDLEANIPIYYRNSWKNPGDVTNYEVFIEGASVHMNSVTTTRRLYSSDFIRLKTLNFGFTLPQTWTRNAGIDKVRLFASANNLWTWAAHDYYDPEAVSGGTAIWGTPPLKTVTFGVNVNF